MWRPALAASSLHLPPQLLPMYPTHLQGDIEPATPWRTSIATACKAAKAFSIIGLLGNVVVIPAVLANFKILPAKFHVHGRMASMGSILTTGKLKDSRPLARTHACRVPRYLNVFAESMSPLHARQLNPLPANLRWDAAGVLTPSPRRPACAFQHRLLLLHGRHAVARDLSADHRLFGSHGYRQEGRHRLLVSRVSHRLHRQICARERLGLGASSAFWPTQRARERLQLLENANHARCPL